MDTSLTTGDGTELEEGAELPGWANVPRELPDDPGSPTIHDDLEGNDTSPGGETPEDEGPPRARPPSLAERLKAALAGRLRNSSTTSTGDVDLDYETARATATMVRQIVVAITTWVNEVHRRGSEQRWLIEEIEADDVSNAVGRIVARRIPQELATGDAKDLLVIGSTAVGYTARNVADVDPVTKRKLPPPPAG